MQSELKLHRFVITTVVTLLIAFIAALIYLNPTLANQRLEVVASLVLVVLVAAAFVTIGLVEGTIAFQFGTAHKRELVVYLALGLLSIGTGLYLALSRQASLHTVGLVVAPHAFLFGLGELRIAHHLEHHRAIRRALYLCGAFEIVLGISLLSGGDLSNEHMAMLLGYVAILSTLQLLPFLFFRLSHRPRHTDSTGDLPLGGH